MEMTQKQIEIEAQNYLNGLDLPENADKQLILENFKNGMAWMLMLIKEEKQQWIAWLEKQGEQNLIMAKSPQSPQLGEQKQDIVEQLTAFAVHLQKRGAFRDDLCMDFEHEAQSFVEFQKFNEKK